MSPTRSWHTPSHRLASSPPLAVSLRIGQYDGPQPAANRPSIHPKGTISPKSGPHDQALEGRMTTEPTRADRARRPTLAPRDELPSLKDFTYPELERFVREELGEKRFRSQQLYNWLYARLADDYDQMTNLPKGLRQRLSESTRLHSLTVKAVHASPDGAAKIAFTCSDGAVIESVWIPNQDRNTLCVSSQVGCAMGCSFCLTARMGLVRNLSIGEIVDQIVHARRLFPEEEHGRLTNIVMMGMGEPLHNYDNVLGALRVMTDDKGLGLSNRKVTVSTSGLVPEIKKLGEDITINLAISLNATTDELRDVIMPVNKKWPLEVLLQTLRDFPLKQRRRITMEYVLLAGVNDSIEDAARMVTLLHGIPTKVNLIPWNPHAGSGFERPDRDRILNFQDYLLRRNINALIRETRGLESMAACGQLGKAADKLPKRFRRGTPGAQMDAEA